MTWKEQRISHAWRFSGSPKEAISNILSEYGVWKWNKYCHTLNQKGESWTPGHG
jgi:hypothetical protein